MFKKSPKVNFHYSSIYDHIWRDAWENRTDKEGEYPTMAHSMKFLKNLEKDWRKVEAKVFKATASVGGRPWSVISHDCYITGKAGAFSIPLTIPSGLYKSQPPGYMVDVLTHELIHRYISQEEILRVKNLGDGKRWDNFRKNFPKENFNVIAHVIVQALHELVYLKVFNKSRLVRDKKFLSQFPDYKRAWDIISEHGAQNIVDQYFGR